MALVTDIMQTQDVLNFVRDREYPTQLGEALFPSEKQNSLDVTYIKGNSGSPVSASVHALDTEAEIASREGFDTVSQRVAMIKRKIAVNEELQMRLNEVKDSSPSYQNIVRQLYNDVDKMVISVQTRIERMRYEALSTGKITVDENNAKFVIDYGVEDSQKATSLWTEPTANPVEDLEKWMQAMADKGVTPTRALTSRKVLSALSRNTTLQKYIFGNERLVSQGDINNFLQAQGLPVIATEDRTFRVQNADGTYTTQRYLADNKIILLGDGPVGRTVYAPTPEEIRLINDPSIDFRSIGNIVAMVYNETVDPVATYTKAVAMALPSFEGAGEIFIGEVGTPTV